MKNKIRQIFSRTLSLFLVIIQYIPVVGPWYGIMLLPMIIYFLTVLTTYPEFIAIELSLLFFSKNFIFVRFTIITGLIIFLWALSDFLKRTSPIVTTGLYSKVRHPQYLGLTIITLGFTLMGIELRGTFEILGIWIISLTGYILLAHYEEKHLLKENFELYRKYMEKTPFMLPVTPPKKFSEILFTMILMLSIALLCSLIATIF